MGAIAFINFLTCATYIRHTLNHFTKSAHEIRIIPSYRNVMQHSLSLCFILDAKIVIVDHTNNFLSNFVLLNL